MDYEQIGKEAVKAGYDGGGIWQKRFLGGIRRAWKNDGSEENADKLDIFNPPGCKGWWPDFSYPETEGAAQAWIAEKYNKDNCYILVYPVSNSIECHVIIGFPENALSKIVGKGVSKAEAILAAIKSLGLGKKDNSPMGLNKRLLEVGFREKGCRWVRYNELDSCLVSYPLSDFLPNKRYDDASLAQIKLFPDGSHPSTIGVATAWLRSFAKIGESLYFFKSACGKWFARGWEAFKGFDSELEALVEFAEWAKEQGLME